MSYNDIRLIFEKVWDFNQNIEPMDAEHGSKKQESPAKEKSPEKVMEEEIDTQEELKEGVKHPAAKRKKSIPRKSTRKRQKLEEDAEKDELKGFLDIVPREEAPIEVESISNKVSPIWIGRQWFLTEDIHCADELEAIVCGMDVEENCFRLRGGGARLQRLTFHEVSVETRARSLHIPSVIPVRTVASISIGGVSQKSLINHSLDGFWSHVVWVGVVR
ncbi:hypothetical protein Tco_1066946 [Tanacetum coccineum]|uniref:Uncharacterized protein n=1 Tax=Tanacetum coccineum TaxID=301880 RepID=A0ABQ5HCR0_9ASTR